MNIDNNSKFIQKYPVLFTPKRYHLLKKDQNLFFLNVLVVMDSKVTNCVIFKKIMIDVDPITFKMEEAMFETLKLFS